MDTIQLPLAEAPVNCYQYLMYPLAILAGDDDYLPWFYSNYIQLVWNKDFSHLLTFYYGGETPFCQNIPWLDFQFLYKHTFIENKIDIDSFIMHSINNGWYFYSSFDEFYIPCRLSYQKNHFVHDFLLHGYNPENQTYSIFGYTEQLKRDTCAVGFKEFKEAFLAGIETVYHAVLMKKRKGISYDFDIINVYDLLLEYYYSRMSSAKYRAYSNQATNKVFGMDLYRHLIKMFELIISGAMGNDRRPLHLLYEHKCCMTGRVKYMNDHGFLNSCGHLETAFKEIENKAAIIRNTQLKYTRSGEKDAELLKHVIARLNELEAMERKAIEILLNEIKPKIVI